MDEASVAKLEELHLGAVSEGEEWLRSSLLEMSAREVRVLAVAGGVESHSNRNWLPAAELRSSLVKVLAPADGGWVRAKMCFNMRQTRHHGDRAFLGYLCGIFHTKMK